MGLLMERGNDALNVNPPPPVHHYLSENGSNWLWAVTAVFCLSFLAFVGLSFKPRGGEKIFHYLYTIALLVGAIAYFAMASDLAWSVIGQANNHGYGLTAMRQIFFAKYIFWVVAFAVVIIALGLLSGVSWATIFFNVALAWTWVISYLVSAYTATNYKWGFFAFGTFAWLLLAASTMMDGRTHATRVGSSADYMKLAGLANLLWFLYPIAFGLTDGGNVIGVTPGFIFFGILDLLMIPVMAFATIALAKKWDYGRLNLHFTQYGRVHNSGTFPEKHHAPATGVVGGHTAV